MFQRLFETLTKAFCELRISFDFKLNLKGNLCDFGKKKKTKKTKQCNLSLHGASAKSTEASFLFKELETFSGVPGSILFHLYHISYDIILQSPKICLGKCYLGYSCARCLN